MKECICITSAQQKICKFCPNGDKYFRPHKPIVTNLFAKHKEFFIKFVTKFFLYK